MAGRVERHGRDYFATPLARLRGRRHRPPAASHPGEQPRHRTAGRQRLSIGSLPARRPVGRSASRSRKVGAWSQRLRSGRPRGQRRPSSTTSRSRTCIVATAVARPRFRADESGWRNKGEPDSFGSPRGPLPRCRPHAPADLVLRTAPVALASPRARPPRAPPRRSRRPEHRPRTQHRSRTCVLPRRGMSRRRILLRDIHGSRGRTDTRSPAAPRGLSPWRQARACTRSASSPTLEPSKTSTGAPALNPWEQGLISASELGSCTRLGATCTTRVAVRRGPQPAQRAAALRIGLLHRRRREARRARLLRVLARQALDAQAAFDVIGVRSNPRRPGASLRARPTTR
jgi:hypothetical protein